MLNDTQATTLTQTQKKLTIKKDTLRRLGEVSGDGKPMVSTLEICTRTVICTTGSPSGSLCC
jgi:hypothetical protein